MFRSTISHCLFVVAFTLIVAALVSSTHAQSVQLPGPVVAMVPGSGPDHLYVLAGQHLLRIDPRSGKTYPLDGQSAGAWPDVKAMAISTTSGKIFIISGTELYGVDKGTGVWTARHGQAKGGWPNTMVMYSLWPPSFAETPDDLEGGLYIVTGNELYHADEWTGNWSGRPGQAKGSWPDVKAMTGIIAKPPVGGLYIISGNELYHADPRTGNWSARHGQAKGGWPEVTAMASAGGRSPDLYIISQNELYHAEPATGFWSGRPGERAGFWSDASAMVYHWDNLYIFNNERLYRVDPDSGNWLLIPLVRG